MDIHPPHPAHPWNEIQRFGEQVALRSILFVEEQMNKTASERYKKALE